MPMKFKLPRCVSWCVAAGSTKLIIGNVLVMEASLSVSFELDLS